MKGIRHHVSTLLSSPPSVQHLNVDSIIQYERWQLNTVCRHTLWDALLTQVSNRACHVCDIYVMFVINRKEHKTYANKIFYAEKKSLSTISEKRGMCLKYMLILLIVPLLFLLLFDNPMHYRHRVPSPWDKTQRIYDLEYKFQGGLLYPLLSSFHGCGHIPRTKK